MNLSCNRAFLTEFVSVKNRNNIAEKCSAMLITFILIRYLYKYIKKSQSLTLFYIFPTVSFFSYSLMGHFPFQRTVDLSINRSPNYIFIINLFLSLSLARFFSISRTIFLFVCHISFSSIMFKWNNFIDFSRKIKYCSKVFFIVANNLKTNKKKQLFNVNLYIQFSFIFVCTWDAE